MEQEILVVCWFQVYKGRMVKQPGQDGPVYLTRHEVLRVCRKIQSAAVYVRERDYVQNSQWAARILVRSIGDRKTSVIMAVYIVV